MNLPAEGGAICKEIRPRRDAGECERKSRIMGTDEFSLFLPIRGPGF